MFSRLFLPFALAAAAVFASCKPVPQSGARPAGETVVYEGRGVLRKLDGLRRKAVIAHETIPGYMEAMTMEFDAPDAAALAGLEAGDLLTFRLSVTETRSWIDAVRKVGHTAIPADGPPTLEMPAVGAELPDCALVDERGEAISLRGFSGRALAFTFIFTRCPLPNFCPLMNRHFAEVARELSADPSRDRWQLLSISFDPEYDTPDRLAKYAESYQSYPRHWKFATGLTAEIGKLAAACGLAVARNGAVTEHNLRTVVVDPAGRVRKVFTGNEWTPEELIAELRAAMSAAP